VQIRRGDIPYFFSFFYDKEVYYYTDRDHSFEAVKEIPEGLTYFLQPRPDSLTEMFSRERFFENLLPAGLLELSENLLLFTKETPGELKGCGFRIEIDPDLITVSTDEGGWALCRSFVDKEGIPLPDTRPDYIRTARSGGRFEMDLVEAMKSNLGVPVFRLW
jgi:hypothetical protein